MERIMSVRPVNNMSFKGYINVSDLSAYQKHILNSILPTLERQVKPIKHLKLNIAGSSDAKTLSTIVDKKPTYLHMWTQVADAYAPTAQVVTQNTNPRNLLNLAMKLISEHKASDLYQKFEMKDRPFWQKVSDKIKNFFKK